MSKDIQEILKYQYIDFEANETLTEILENEKELEFAIHYAYNFGVVQGKRQERARRKGEVKA